MSKKDSKGRVLQKGESQRIDGRYQFRMMVGSQSYWVYGATLKEMRENKEKLLKQLDSGINVEKQKMTLNDLVDEYLKMKEMTIQKSTSSTMKFTYDRYVREGLGKRRICDIRRSEIKAFYLQLLKEKELAIATVSRISEIISPALETAVYDDIIIRNPASKVLGEIKREMHAKPTPVHVPAPEEIKAVMKYMLDSPCFSDTIKNLLTVLYGTGLRVGEITALTWDCIDFEQGSLSVRRAIGYVRDENGHAYQILKQPKSEAGKRTIPMITAVRKALENELHFQQTNKIVQDGLEGVTDFCFVSNRRKPFTREAIHNQVRRMIRFYNESVENPEDRVKDFTTHAIRHAFATMLCMSTSDLKAIQEIMGHSDISMTLNIYASATKEAKKKSMEGFEENAGL